MLAHRPRVEMVQRLNIHFTLNGRKVSAEVRPDETLVEMLEYRFDLRGARESCGQGLCGCCTVYVDSKPVSSCLFLAVRADSTMIDTIEGLASADTLDPVQQAFVDAGAFQCGFCTPGFIMMVKQLLKDNPNPSEDDVKHYLIGNLCRCSAYPEILDAVKLAASRLAAVSAR
jgi:carbon-monoxide dehydrogenase small subunit